MGGVDLGACVTFGIDALKRNPVFQIVGTLLVGLLGGMTLGILYGPLAVGYYRALEKEQNGGTAEVGDIFQGFDQFVPALIVSIVGGIAITIGFILLIIPGLILFPILPAALVLVAKGETDGIAALTKAFNGLKDNLVMAAVTYLVLLIIGGLGSIAFGIGQILTMPVFMAGGFLLANQMLGGAVPASAEEAPAGAEGDEQQTM